VVARTADGEHDGVVFGRHRRSHHPGVVDEDRRPVRRRDVVAVDREPGAALHDDVQLLVAVPTGSRLVVIRDDSLAGLALKRRPGAERAYVERAAEVDERLVLAGSAELLRKRANAITGLRCRHDSLLEG
jgi:hypothetical protein